MSREKKKNLISIVLFVAFAALFVIGFLNGEADTVFRKASRICLECIGIG